MLWQKNVSRNATAERYVYIRHSLLSIAVCLFKGKNKQLQIFLGDINIQALEQSTVTLYQIQILNNVLLQDAWSVTVV